MANVVTNVTAGKPNVAGAIYVAPLGSTLPTTATAALAAEFVPLGYVSEDGLTNSNSPSSTDVKAWGGDTVLSLQTDRPDSFKFKLIETLNEDVLGEVYGSSNVAKDGNDNLTISVKSDELTGRAWVIDMVARGNRAKRIVIPNGKISALGDIAYKDNEAVGYDLTITDMPDSSGVYHYEYIQAAQ